MTTDRSDPGALLAKKGLGGRLKAARQSAKLTQTQAAEQLGLGSKATISSWEIGNNVPDALTLGRLAKLYGTTADALIWDDAISMEAIQIAVQFDALNDKQRRTFQAMWMAYFAEAKSDAEVEDGFRRASGHAATPPSDAETKAGRHEAVKKP